MECRNRAVILPKVDFKHASSQGQASVELNYASREDLRTQLTQLLSFTK